MDFLLGDLGKPDKQKRKAPSKLEWDATKKIHGNRCLMCGKSEKACGGLKKAHLKAYSKGGNTYIPLCANCHSRLDKGDCSQTELSKIGIPPDKYKYFQPKKRTPTKQPKDKLLGNW